MNSAADSELIHVSAPESVPASALFDRPFSVRFYHYNSLNLHFPIVYQEFYLIRSGDHSCDLTGLRVWEGAVLLTRCLTHFAIRSNKFDGINSALELGSGCGLSGVALAQALARHREKNFQFNINHTGTSNSSTACAELRISLSDRDATVVELLNYNLLLNRIHNFTSAIQLSWGQNNNSNTTKKENSFHYDFLFASDVVYPDTDEATIRKLFESVEENLICNHSSSHAAAAANWETMEKGTSSSSSSFSAAVGVDSSFRGSFMCAYVERNRQTTRDFIRIADQSHFRAEIIDSNEFVDGSRSPRENHSSSDYHNIPLNWPVVDSSFPISRDSIASISHFDGDSVDPAAFHSSLVGFIFLFRRSSSVGWSTQSEPFKSLLSRGEESKLEFDPIKEEENGDWMPFNEEI